MKHPSRMTEGEIREAIGEVEAKIRTFRACRYQASADAQEFIRHRYQVWLDRAIEARIDAQCLAAREQRA